MATDGAKREVFNRLYEHLNRLGLRRLMAGDLLKRDLDAEADEALEAARTMPNGKERWKP